MKLRTLYLIALSAICFNAFSQDKKPGNNNPIFEGWYADPEGVVFDDTYWVFPTFSADYDKQLHFDAFSSKDLVNWQKHESILDTTEIKWLRQALWAPSVIEKDDKYYLFFGANDIQRPGRDSYDSNNDINHYGGIGVSVADHPGGPYKDYLGKPLISDFYNDAQPIDQFVFKDTDGTYYFFYGGWSHCNLGRLNEDFTGFISWEDGNPFKEITPEGYVEGPFMFLRNGIYYFMWSEGGWTNGTYKVAYAMADKATGPFKRIGTILESKEGAIATGAGHHSVIKKRGTDEYIMVYHRRPIPNEDRDHRVTCMDVMEFNDDGTIKPIKMTFEGVAADTSKKSKENESDYTNPLDVEFGDPYILDNGNGTYYMYGTGGGAEDGFATYSSTDLVNWKNEGQVYHGNTETSWNLKNFWAPEVYKIDSKYYLFYSADKKDNPTNEGETFSIGVAVSDSPKGPFEDLKNEPLFDPGYPIIDGNVFQDDDGKYYLYYSRACYKHSVESEIADWTKKEGLYDEIEESWVYGVELSPDFKSVIAEPVLLLRPPVKTDDKNAEWESRSVTSKEINRRWTEGSFTFKHNDTYYMMYSANHYAGPNYAVGYATAEHPLGPYTKAENNPVLQKNIDQGGDVTGTGHNMVLFLDGGKKMYAIYHGRTKPTGENRVVFMDEMEILEDGTLVVRGPTTSPQPHPLENIAD